MLKLDAATALGLNVILPDYMDGSPGMPKFGRNAETTICNYNWMFSS